MNPVFLTTRFTDDIYKYIVLKCFLDVKKQKKESLEIKVIKQKKFPDFNFLFYCLVCFFKGYFFNKEKLVFLQYQKVYFGRQLLASTFRNFKSYTSTFNFFYILLKNLFTAGRYFRTADYYINNYNFRFVYLDHLEYLNSIYYFKFINNNKDVYTNKMPRGIVRSNQKKIENIFKLDFKKNSFNQNQKDEIDKSSADIFTSLDNYLPWLHYTNYETTKFKNLKDFDYIVYAHSFTDAQLKFEYDGFINTLDWLIFTVNVLKKKGAKFIIKSHPNFYRKTSIKDINERSDWDKKIYTKFIRQLISDPNILVINEPILNFEIAKYLDNQKCIVITKHGTVQLEMIYHNFKVITSESNMLDPKYSLTNTWKNKLDYKKILQMNWNELEYANKDDFRTVMDYLFLNDQMCYGKKYYLNVLKEKMLSLNLINKNISNEDLATKFKMMKNKEQMINDISFPINIL